LREGQRPDREELIYVRLLIDEFSMLHSEHIEGLLSATAALLGTVLDDDFS
jgi:hypothetical protein